MKKQSQTFLPITPRTLQSGSPHSLCLRTMSTDFVNVHAALAPFVSIVMKQKEKPPDSSILPFCIHATQRMKAAFLHSCLFSSSASSVPLTAQNRRLFGTAPTCFSDLLSLDTSLVLSPRRPFSSSRTLFPLSFTLDFCGRHHLHTLSFGASLRKQ